jgi:poly(3-hydroxybutyrate) depolymerase
MKKIVMLSLVLMSGSAAQAQTVNLQGVISNSSGQPIKGAAVTLVRQGLFDTTGTDGHYSFEKPVAVKLPAIVPQTEKITMRSGVLRFALNKSSPVKAELFTARGNLLKKIEMKSVAAGTYRVDFGEYFRTTNFFIVRASIGSHVRSFSYMPIGSGRNVLNAPGTPAGSIGGTLAQAATVLDTIRVTANGFKTREVIITSYENQAQNITLETNGHGSTGSIGCGKDLSDLKSGTYKITSAGLNREYIINIPANYDKNKPYRLIFGMHCFGSNMQGVANDKYYQLKRFADSTKTDCIFVAPNGIITNGNAMWDQDEKDHTFFDDMLKLFKEKLCVDTTRVFSCGFSYGAMFTNALSLTHQNVLRAVACYAPANWNIYVPANTHQKIAYMSTTGISDPNCKYIYNEAKREGGKFCVLTHAEDNGCTIPANENLPTATSGSRSHIIYDFKDCDEGYPVKFCSFDGAHQAGPMDNISGDDSRRSWIPVETWKFFMQF